MRRFFVFGFLFCAFSAKAQTGYWQQRVEYSINVDFDVEKSQYTGNQKLIYYNNSPDTLQKIYFHLYPNAFQPGSMMDVRSRTIVDPDLRVRDRISKLEPEDQGFLEIKSLLLNGKFLEYKTSETILEVELDKPIMPRKKVKFEIEFLGQVPVQIRRSGKYNSEGVAYSMSQWYPKICAYDQDGWHPDPYIGREFHGVWGDYDVNITIDSAFTLGGTGVLQNPREIGHGYTAAGTSLKRPDGDKLTWKFKAKNVHDFMWAADDNYKHDIVETDFGLELHFLYKNEPDLFENWEKLKIYTVEIFRYANAHFGVYPWTQYSVIQGGDGGMEYPMATLITGHRGLGSLVGVTVHEVMHSWYQGALAINEGYYSWFDEGFTQYASSRIMSHLFNPDEDTRIGNYYRSYYEIAESGKEEPMATRADYFKTNTAYGDASYGKGAVFAAQLGYIIGDDALNKCLKRFFYTWKFKHPTPKDFIRIVEKETGIELDWYYSYMVNTTEKIDYGIKRIEALKNETIIELERMGEFPMPIDLHITYRDGTEEILYIPMRIMRGEKPKESEVNRTILPVWQWTNKKYQAVLKKPMDDIKTIEIDPSKRMADVDRSNNKIELKEGTQFIISN